MPEHDKGEFRSIRPGQPTEATEYHRNGRTWQLQHQGRSANEVRAALVRHADEVMG